MPAMPAPLRRSELPPGEDCASGSPTAPASAREPRQRSQRSSNPAPAPSSEVQLPPQPPATACRGRDATPGYWPGSQKHGFDCLTRRRLNSGPGWKGPALLSSVGRLTLGLFALRYFPVRQDAAVAGIAGASDARASKNRIRWAAT
jgi:hypothetical protein